MPGGYVTLDYPWEGRIHFTVSGGDDRTPDERLGYRVRVTGGLLPGGFKAPSEPVCGWTALDSTGISRTSGFTLTWKDEAPYNAMPFKFGVVVSCLDRAGNESAPSDTFIVTHVGHD